MEPWCGDIMGKHISSVEPCIGSKELTVRACVYIIVGGFGFGSVDFFMHIHISGDGHLHGCPQLSCLF